MGHLHCEDGPWIFSIVSMFHLALVLKYMCGSAWIGDAWLATMAIMNTIMSFLILEYLYSKCLTINRPNWAGRDKHLAESDTVARRVGSVFGLVDPYNGFHL